MKKKWQRVRRMKERHALLVEYVSRHGKVEVNELAEYLKTSNVTVRKDLDALSERGILKRERGFAVLNDPNDINYRMAFHYQLKKQIAEAATDSVEDGETLIIEAGSTCALFAEELAKKKKDITIITNSAHIANFVKDFPNVNIVLLGGNYQKKWQAVVGPMTKACIKELMVDKIFVGADGYSRNNGFTGDDLIRLDTLRTMMESAKHTYVLTESEKFKKPGTVSFLKLEDVYEIITDSGIPEEELVFLKEQGIKVKII